MTDPAPGEAAPASPRETPPTGEPESSVSPPKPSVSPPDAVRSASALVVPEPAEPGVGRRSPFGLFRFTIEGRRAPALFVGGWLGTLVGVGILVIGIIAGGTLAAGVMLLLGLTLLTLGLVLLGGSQSVERQASGEAYGGPSPILLLATTVAATYLAAALLGLGLTALGLRPSQAGSAVVDFIIVCLEAGVALALVRLMVVGTGALSWRDMGFSRDRRSIGTGLVSGAVFAIPLVFVTGIVASLLLQVVGQVPPSPLPPTGTAPGAILNVITGAGVAPVWEEVLYRGVTLTAWLRAGNPTRAIVASSVLFAAAHVLEVSGATFTGAAEAALVAAVARIPIALTLGWLYARTRSIWAPIGLHAAFNAILIVLGEVSQAAG